LWTYFVTKQSNKRSIGPSTDEFFQSTIANETDPVLVKFGAEWCGPCKALDATLAKYQQSNDALKVVFVDTDKQMDLSSHYGVRSIPHLFLFQDGKVIDDQVGAISIGEIQSWIATKTKPRP